MPLRAFSVFVAGVQRGHLYRQQSVLMPLRAFSVFVARHRIRDDLQLRHVLMPLRAFSVFVGMDWSTAARHGSEGLNALTGIQCIRR